MATYDAVKFGGRWVVPSEVESQAQQQQRFQEYLRQAAKHQAARTNPFEYTNQQSRWQNRPLFPKIWPWL